MQVALLPYARDWLCAAWPATCNWGGLVSNQATCTNVTLPDSYLKWAHAVCAGRHQGTLPGELGSASRLSQLLLSNNHLEGSLPTFIAFNPHLYVVALNNNNFSGPIPRDWCREDANNVSRIDVAVGCHAGPVSVCPSACQQALPLRAVCSGSRLVSYVWRYETSLAQLL